MQRNKVKHIAPFISAIHAVDSDRLAATIDKEAAKQKREISCLLQVHIAMEESKFGFSPEELIRFLETAPWERYPNIRLSGLMAMASNTENKAQIEEEFARVQELFNTIANRWKSELPHFTELSTGMSGDYPIAVRYGSTMVRVGSKIFS